ncbi:MAG: hypothetical protein A3F13_08750 [Gammaproteobacteria bacterium RIFCSPHIGHO2_12_FULL_40_19]|nr:MAG: hypothetical protein A3F13_08750 [Gammaproteobacteria bacterium RIFCSPHIGHO2_12_FULL_40_19]
MSCKIKHISYHLSSNVLTNEDLAKDFPEYSAQEIYKKTGIKQRFVTTRNIIGSDLAVAAAEQLFRESSFKKENVEFILFCTETPDYIAPATACLLQSRLRLKTNIGALDLPSGCSGFTNALGVGKALIESGQCDNVLLLFGDTPSLTCHPKDFELRSLFSDAGAAAWLDKSEQEAIGNVVYGADGSGAKNLFVDRSCFRNPVDEAWLKTHKEAGGMPFGQLEMNGLNILTFALKEVPKLVNAILEKNNLAFEQIDLFFFHQASRTILRSIQKKLRIPDEKMAYYIENNGNTISVSIPLALKEALKESRIKEGAKVLIAGFGIGFSWSGTVITY